MIKKNKRGIAYFTLIGPFVLILLGLLLMVFVNPVGDTVTDVDFGNTLISLDLISAKLPAEEFFMKEQLDSIINNAKKEFVQKSIEKESLQRLETSTDSDGVGCEIDDLDLWYNQENIDANEREKESKKDIIVDNGDSDEFIEDETTTKKEEEYFCPCLPNFEENLEEELQDYFEEKIEKEVNNALEAQEISKSPKIKTEYDPETNSINVDITTYYKESSKIGNVILEIDYENSYELDSYPQLLEALTKIIPKIPQQLKDKIPSCIKSKSNTEQEEDSESICMQETIFNLIKEENEKLSQEYVFEILRIEEYKHDEYLALQFIITKPKTKEEVIKFGIIVKDNIPYSLIEFELENSRFDNVIDINIKQPKFHEKVLNYVVIYSYDNFFSPESDSYNKLLKLLRENNIPDGFIEDFTSKEGMYAHSGPEFESNVNLIVAGKDGFTNNNEDKTIMEKKIQLYQIYDKKTQKYELLEKDRPVYVFVFATDKNYNYYVENLNDKTKGLKAISNLGPIPLKKEQALIGGEVVGAMKYQNTFYLNIKDYQDPNFDHFDIYVLGKGGTLNEYCTEANFCYYLDGSNLLTTEAIGKRYLISSDPTAMPSSDKDEIIKTEIFNPNLKLENNNDYDVYVIPATIDRKGTIQTSAKTYQFSEKYNQKDMRYYLLDENAKLPPMIPFVEKGVNIVDKKEPHIKDSIEVIGITRLNGFEENPLVLNWRPKNGEDIEKLDIKIIKDNNLESISREYIDLNGIIPNTDRGGFETLQIVEIIPIDTSGNFPTFNGETHTLSYTK